MIAVGFGTLKHPPYLWNSNSEFQTFDVSGAGYRMHFNDILHALGLNKPSILSCEESEELMSNSMNVLSSLFSILGESAQERESRIQIKTKHTPLYLSRSELQVRAQLQKVLCEIQF